MSQRAVAGVAGLVLLAGLAACVGSGGRYAAGDGADRRAANGPIGDYSTQPFATQPALFARPNYAHSNWDTTSGNR